MGRFEDIAVGTRFEYNGNGWIKQSSRTGYLIEFDRWFYFCASDIVREV
jgi:hypothetical protein